MEPCAHLTHGLAVAPRHGRPLSPCGPSIATAGTSNTGEGIRVVKFTLKTILAVFGLAILFGYLALMVLAPEATPKPDVQHVQPVVPHTKSCKTIPASKWNHLLRVNREVTGKPIDRKRIKNRPVCVGQYAKLKRVVTKRKKQLARKLETNVRFAIARAFDPIGRTAEAMRVAYCESTHNRFARNSGGYSGLFQLGSHHFHRLRGLPWYHAYANARAAAEIVRGDGGWGQWSCQPG